MAAVTRLPLRAPLLVALAGALAGVAGASAPAQGPAACPPDAALAPIRTVQGTGLRSPLEGSRLQVEGVVTAAYPGDAGLGGFFLQDPAPAEDAAGSTALFVQLPPRLPPPRAGERVRVTGTVREVRRMTEIAATALRSCGRAALPAARPLTLPVASVGAWEALEGMLVQLPRSLTITGVYDLGRYGELTLADRRLFAPSQRPGGVSPARHRIVLDDGSRRLDPRPVPYLLPGGLPPRVGDSVVGGTAVVAQAGAGDYRLEPVDAPRLRRTNPRPARAPAPAGSLRVATFNLHDFFTTLGERGAGSEPAYRLQRRKLAAALAGLDADVIALQELENDGMRSENVLLSALNRRLGGNRYAAVPDPASGTGRDRIKQGLFYRPARLTLVATASDPQPLFERAPVAATFRTSAGATLTVVSIHLKSKGGCPAAGDVDRGDGCWNLRRSAQAEAVVAFTRSLGGGDVLVAGDLNSYAAEPPLAAFAGAGFIDVTRSLPSAQRYSYVYRGLSGTLDYLLASPHLASELEGAGIWHIDADESPLVAADGRQRPGVADAYRASDHDPVLAGFDTSGERPPSASAP